MRPLCLVDPEDPEGWAIPDSYMFGPSLWVAPVLDEGATERRTYLPRGDWFDWWTGERLAGGRWIETEAPLDRIPLWVRDGSLIVTYPAGDVARGLGEEDPSRPLEATLWGEPALGHASAHLADGTHISWRRGEWSVATRSVRFLGPPDRPDPLGGSDPSTTACANGGGRSAVVQPIGSEHDVRGSDP